MSPGKQALGGNILPRRLRHEERSSVDNEEDRETETRIRAEIVSVDISEKTL